ncbi:hypothetical protein [Rhodopirellula sp. MGV]|uniref:hypothetical protein n=1 Tax=Rhodopirellula sp. MGV TaxID=2023130 RepID=UPI000B96B7B7|nr:hypothetical protein [Rhodopirellula sp. MGV]OYP37534.1 hypothetical protein CGZ80_05275 [Rhodopirellula sp. MGV]PNY37938.1 hypothetical protein C2E31_05415 [Rhodopirellula baltica]
MFCHQSNHRNVRTAFVALGAIVFSVVSASNSANAVEVLASAIAAPSVEGVGPAPHRYGVAIVEIPLAVPLVGQDPRPLSVTSQSGRLHYPVTEDIDVPIVPTSERPVPQPGNGRLLGRIGKLIRELTDDDMPKTQIVSRRATFLFTGDAPLTIEIADDSGPIGTYELVPKADAAMHATALKQWWDAYIERAKSFIDKGDYPPWVETYLVAMLSGRTGNGLPDWFIAPVEKSDPLLETLKYLTGAEEVTKAIFRRTAAGLTDGNEPRPSESPDATVPLPEPPRWQKAALPPVDESVVTEGIADRVPPECFYIRFGSFNNYLWFLDLAEEYGGDIGRMITLRGTVNKSTERFQNQIATKINQLSRMLGASVVEDQAVIGRDLFTNDGASMGVILKASNAFLLRSSLNNDRSSRASGDDKITLKQVDVDGHKVSLLSKTDNSIRSFLAEDNGYFLITNSKTLVKRFFEVGKSRESLAATESFRLSRSLVPVDREDTIFAYFSPEMLQGLVSPEYMIELRRRSAAESDVSLVHLARLAAAAEANSVGGAPLGVEELIEQGFLPLSFGKRPDGSGIVAIGDRVIDTMRGARGSFLPIADVEIDNVTLQEAEWYQTIANEYSERFPQMDPIIVALRREDVPGSPSLERITVHAEIAPLTPEKYGKWAKQLGPPTKVAIRSAPDDIVTLQAHVASEQLGPPTHLFVGIKDNFPPEPEDFDGLLNIYRSLKSLPGYLGAWPQPGALDRLPLGLGRGRPVGPGMSRLLGGLYRYTGGGFSVLSFQDEVLTSTLPFLEASDVSEAATVRGRIGSLLGSQLEDWVNNQLYQRAARSSVAGAEFLTLMTRQLDVPPEEAFQRVRQVLDADLQCSLGGQYQYNPQTHRWESTAWNGPEPAEEPPIDYVSPLLHWFRGGQFTMTQYADRLVVDGRMTVARKTARPE